MGIPLNKISPESVKKSAESEKGSGKKSKDSKSVSRSRSKSKRHHANQKNEIIKQLESIKEGKEYGNVLKAADYDTEDDSFSECFSRLQKVTFLFFKKTNQFVAILRCKHFSLRKTIT